MKTIELWYAVDQDGEGYFYTDEPYRADYTNVWGSAGEVYSVREKLFEMWKSLKLLGMTSR